MAREKPLKAPDDPGDIPSWFMTYSDVITLLMTFFILLLTFATTEPDRFERIQQTMFAGGTGTGIAGEKIKGPENESFIQRIRPRAARMAMSGSEMAPQERAPSKKSIGRGLLGVSDEEAAKDVMSTNQFDLPIDSVVSKDNRMTSKGIHIAGLLSSQLDSLPVNLSLQCSKSDNLERATQFVLHLYQIEKIRPGQVGISIVDDVASNDLRFSIERFEK